MSDALFRETLVLAAEAGVPYSGVLCGRATWKDGIPEFVKNGADGFRDWLSDKGAKNIQALNAVLGSATPWHER